MEQSFLKKAVELAGGQVKLASGIRDWHFKNGRNVKVRQQHVWKWLNDAKTPMPPAEHCRAIEDITGISRYDLRPDIFGDSPPSAPSQEAA